MISPYHNDICDIFNKQREFMPKFIIKIDKNMTSFFNNDDICCYCIDKDSPENLMKQAQQSDKLVLTEDIDFCRQKKLDGIIINHIVDEKFAKYIKPLQKEFCGKYMGIYCQPNRHEAMLSSEAEPDFVIFNLNKQNQEEAFAVLQWYAELFLIQFAVPYFENIDEKILKMADFVILNMSEYKILVDKIKRLD